MATDIARIEKINTLDKYDAVALAEKMCRLIKNDEKAWNRAKIAWSYKSNKMRRVSEIFTERAAELNHKEATRAKDLKFKRFCIHRNIIAKNNLAKIKPEMLKLKKQIEKKVGESIKNPSLSSSNPYNSNTAGFMLIPYNIHKKHFGSDWNTNYVTDYKRSYLGSELSKIATIVKKYNGAHLVLISGDVYILFDFKE